MTNPENNTNPALPVSSSDVLNGGQQPQQGQPQQGNMNDVLGGAGFAQPQGVPAGASDVFDLSGVSGDNAFGFPVVEAGSYNCICSDIDWTQSANSGNWMLKWTFTIMEGPHVGHKFTDYTVLKKSDGSIDDRGLAKVKRYISILNPEYNLAQFNPAQYAAGNTPCSRQIQLRVNKSKDTQNVGAFRNNIQDATPYKPMIAEAASGSAQAPW